jgi:hypothetical protein
MKRMLFTCVFALCIINCFGQFTNDFHNGTDLKGQIDSVVSKTLYVGKIVGRPDTTELVSQSTHIYNKKGQLVESDDRSFMQPEHSAIDSRPAKTFYTYDADGNLTESLRHYTTGQPWVKNTYSKKDSVIEMKNVFCPDNTQVDTDTIKMNANGRITECDTYTKGVGLYIKTYYKYDEAGRLIKEDTYRSDGSLMSKRTCKYNADGDIIEDNNPNGDRADHTFTYQKYDQMHNWIKQIEYVNPYFHIIHERSIVYY